MARLRPSKLVILSAVCSAIRSLICARASAGALWKSTTSSNHCDIHELAGEAGRQWQTCLHPQGVRGAHGHPAAWPACPGRGQQVRQQAQAVRGPGPGCRGAGPRPAAPPWPHVRRTAPSAAPRRRWRARRTPCSGRRRRAAGRGRRRTCRPRRRRAAIQHHTGHRVRRHVILPRWLLLIRSQRETSPARRSYPMGIGTTGSCPLGQPRVWVSREFPAGNRPGRELPAGPAGDCPLGQPLEPHQRRSGRDVSHAQAPAAVIWVGGRYPRPGEGATWLLVEATIMRDRAKSLPSRPVGPMQQTGGPFMFSHRAIGGLARNGRRTYSRARMVR